VFGLQAESLFSLLLNARLALEQIQWPYISMTRRNL